MITILIHNIMITVIIIMTFYHIVILIYVNLCFSSITNW